MTSAQIASVVVALATLVAVAHVMAHLFERLRQPRLVGEILAGVLIGPYVLGVLAPSLSRTIVGEPGPAGDITRMVLDFVHWLGVMMLMFVSGTEVRRVLGDENRRPTAWIFGVGTSLPFVVTLVIAAYLPLGALAGPAGSPISVALVLSIAVAVTSIPVIARIFFDLGILHTRFASLILGAALLEDIALWGVLAVATALSAPRGVADDVAGAVTGHVAATLGFLLAGLFVAPALLRRVLDARWNLIRASSPTGYVIFVMLAFAAVAAVMNVNLVFAAFLAGFGLVGGMAGSQRSRVAEPIEAVKKIAFGTFIPVYFAVVGVKLQLGLELSVPMLAIFLFGSSLLCLLFRALAARLAGFRGLEIVNIAVASNARGGPGIVLASVAYDAGIINGAFFTTLVLTAILTSQAAGVWLGMVLRWGWTLLREDRPAAAAGIVPVAEVAAIIQEEH